MNNTKIFLNKNKNLLSENKDNIVYIEVNNSMKNLPYDNVVSTVNLLDRYDKERLNSDKIRLSFQINPFCSNILFNYKSEIVSGEGSDNVSNLTFNENLRNVYNDDIKISKDWTHQEAIMDTQLNNIGWGFKYHCGLDIFDNHILRKKTFKSSVCPKDYNGTDRFFNTIFDYLRDSSGNTINGYSTNGDTIDKMHLYNNNEIMSFSESVNDNLIEENGWFGFKNKAQLNTLKIYNNKKRNFLSEYRNSFNRVMNTETGCNFISLYPNKALYEFSPIYNSYRNREEYNWKYCLTYPSSSTTKGFDFINEESNSLKAIYYRVTDNEIRVYSISKHNLKIGDSVNLYINNENVFHNGVVSLLGDNNGDDKEYIFSVSNNGSTIGEMWYILTNEDYINGNFIYNGARWLISNNHKYVTDNHTVYYIAEGMINFDYLSRNMSYKKTVNGNEVDYYVRIFSRMPNWKFANSEPSVYNIYNKQSTSGLLSSCQSVDTDFETHLSQLCFAKNVFNDNISQLMYTDDIDLKNLHDNLGRPLSSIYLTLIKNNNGYKKWYGKNGETINPSSSDVEFSHCFGKISCGFELSKRSLINDGYSNVYTLNNTVSDTSFPSVSGCDIGNINNMNTPSDEIDGTEINFYGDLCELSKIEAKESSIQMIGFRFNTAQRELEPNDLSYNYAKDIKTSVIYTDDLDYAQFEGETIINSAYTITHKEGYWYHPHFEVPINTFSNDVRISYGNVVKINKLIKEDNLFKTVLFNNHELEKGKDFILFDAISNTYYHCNVEEIINDRMMTFTSNSLDLDNVKNIRALEIMKPDSGQSMPSYAIPLKDGTTRYAWRELIHNGFDEKNTVENYPFSNGRLYINKNINFYLLRQDPYNIIKSYTKDGQSLIKSDDLVTKLVTPKTIKEENKYISSEDMSCNIKF